MTTRDNEELAAKGIYVVETNAEIARGILGDLMRYKDGLDTEELALGIEMAKAYAALAIADAIAGAK